MEVIACPSCGTENAILRENCEKCGADLLIVKNILSNANKHYNAALELAKQGRNDEAIVELQSAIELWAKNPHYHTLLGTVYARKGLYDLAVRAWETTLALDPRFDKAYHLIDKARKLEHHVHEQQKAQPYKITAFGAGILVVLMLLGLVLVGLRLSDAKSEIDKLQSALNTQPDSTPEIQRLNALLEAKGNQIAVLEKNRAQTEEITKLESLNQEKKIAGLENELQRLKDSPPGAVDEGKIKELTEQVARLTQAKADLEQELRKSKAQVSKVEADLEATRKKMNASEKQNSSLVQDVKDKQSAIEVLQMREEIQNQAFQLWNEQKYAELLFVLEQMEGLEINPYLVQDLRNRAKQQIALREDPLYRARVGNAEQLAKQQEEEERAAYAKARTVKALDRIREDDLEGAKALLKEALAIHPNNETAKNELTKVQAEIDRRNALLKTKLAEAQQAFNQGDFEKAIKGFQEIVASHPDLPEAIAGLESAQEGKAQSEQKQAERERRIAQLSQLADQANAAGQIDKALELYRQWQQLDPENRKIQKSIDRIRDQENQRIEKMNKELAQARELLKKENFDQALETFKVALTMARLAEEKQAITSEITAAGQKKNDFLKAKEEREATFKAAVDEAIQLQKDGLLGEALKEVDRALELYPEDSEAQKLRRSIEIDIDKERSARIDSMMNEAERLEEAGKVQQALERYQQILEIDPNHRIARKKVNELTIDNG